MRNPSISSSGGTSNKRSKTTPCCSKVGMKRGPWTPEEDELLAAYIKREGEGRWRTLPKKAGLLRCGKSCRLRWMNYLRPDVKRGHIDSDEEDLILRLHRLLGNKWSLIAGRIPGRTDNEIKNYWNSHLSKKLISQGIDPRTHKPLNPNNSSSDNHSNLLASSSKPNHNQNPNFAASEGNHDQYYNDQNGNIVDLHNSSNGTDDLCNAKEDDIDCGGDDVFSSFLNSLINEEMFNGQNQQYQLEEEEEEEPNHIVVAPGSDLLKSSSQTNFALDAGWEAPNIMSCASALNPYDVPESHDG